MKEYHQALARTSDSVDPFLKKVFDRITITGPALPAERLQKSPAMIVCSHRSHLDYMILGNEFYKKGINNLRFAAGDNLTNLPYIGPKFQSWGAFPVYRSRATSRQYVFELCDQVVAMLNDGDNIIVFPEGGRSYSGAMMEMKYGILAAAVIAQHQSPDTQVLFLPVTISYEKLPELCYFDVLQKGRRILKEKSGFLNKLQGNALYFGADIVAFAKFLAAPRFGVKYGELFVDYEEPIPVNDIVDIGKHYEPGKRNAFFAHKVSIQKSGEELRRRLFRLYRIFPSHVVASLLCRYGALERAALASRIPEVLEKLHTARRNCATLSAMTPAELVEKGIEQLCFSKAIHIRHNSIVITSDRILQYYSATTDEL